jgi:hypothetical protein
MRLSGIVSRGPLVWPSPVGTAQRYVCESPWRCVGDVNSRSPLLPQRFLPPIPAETGQRYSESLAVGCVVPATGSKLFVDQIEDDIGRSYGVHHSTISRL